VEEYRHLSAPHLDKGLLQEMVTFQIERSQNPSPIKEKIKQLLERKMSEDSND